MELKRFNIKFLKNKRRLDRTMMAKSKEEVFNYMSNKYKDNDLEITIRED